ncbi:hypothetical protein STIAU_1248 [Stigmatella aurantiaca DW4/3-1]|nr:hypothetical protein STIAU_1248 [Stigmatella aurantiaca DW4/3-1]
MLTVAVRKGGGQIQVVDALSLKGQPEGAAFCPSEDCGQPLEPVSAFTRVGSIPVRAFFRHQRGTAKQRPCWGAKGEGGLHFAAKLHLRTQLQELCEKGGALVVEQPCLRCAAGLSHEAVLTEPSDAIRIEHWLDPRRTLKPDVVLLRAGVPLLSFEVRAAHPCSPRKIGALTLAGAQMVEVDAWALLGTETAPTWRFSSPLPLKQAVLPVSRRLCEGCQAAQDDEAACERQAEERRQRAREAEEQLRAQHAREWNEQRAREAEAQRAREADAQRAREAAAQRVRKQEEVHDLSARNAVTSSRSAGSVRMIAPRPPSRPVRISPTVETLAHCIVDVCRPDGVRDEVELVLERETGAYLRAQLVECDAPKLRGGQLGVRYERQLLGEWAGRTTKEHDLLLKKARAAARAAYGAVRDSGCVVDTYGGFRLGVSNVRLWPDPNYWWEPQSQRWVGVQLRELLARDFKISESAVESRLPSEHFRRVLVRLSMRKKDLVAYEALGTAKFAEWLGEKA